MAWPIWTSEIKKLTQKYMPRISEVITIFAKNFEKRMYSPIDVTYISIETVYFPMKQNGITTRNWRHKNTGGWILMPNDSLETVLCLYSICEKVPARVKKTSAWIEEKRGRKLEKNTYKAINLWELRM